MEVERICVSKTDQEVDCELGKWEKTDEAEETVVKLYPALRARSFRFFGSIWRRFAKYFG
jgi:hypothetical protein